MELIEEVIEVKIAMDERAEAIYIERERERDSVPLKRQRTLLICASGTRLKISCLRVVKRINVETHTRPR